ncbi:hypothetical protein RIVM261_024930 [Rivularia sp. IAM M-261]|nr:hypothetical protein RIVM261_024930 [Rivularia sp. IAM M-261]
MLFCLSGLYIFYTNRSVNLRLSRSVFLQFTPIVLSSLLTMKFHVPLGTLRDWEQGAKYPDTATRSYLRVIEKAPHIVMQALED